MNTMNISAFAAWLCGKWNAIWNKLPPICHSKKWGSFDVKGGSEFVHRGQIIPRWDMEPRINGEREPEGGKVFEFDTRDGSVGIYCYKKLNGKKEMVFDLGNGKQAKKRVYGRLQVFRKSTGERIYP